MSVEKNKLDRLFYKYACGELSQMEVCHQLQFNPWDFIKHLKDKNLYRNVDLEDWLNSAELEQ